MALGKTSLKKTDNIDALLGKSPASSQPRDTGTVIRAAKLTADDLEKVELVKKMLGTDNTSEALRWLIKVAWKQHGEKIREIVEKKEAIAGIRI
jgi:hypothetical protein